MTAKLPPDFSKRIKSVTNKRARLVLDRIAETGSITTEELKEIGYDHPPRARMDAKDLGFPMKTLRVKSRNGKKSIAAYSFDLTGKINSEGRAGRIALPKKKRETIITAAGGKCELCGATHDLQIDHRVPYQVAGESLKDNQSPYMVLCGSCNRRKSWVCEHFCANFATAKRVGVCKECYWADPNNHKHVATEKVRRVDIAWRGEECWEYDGFAARCRKDSISVADGLKKMLKSLKQR